MRCVALISCVFLIAGGAFAQQTAVHPEKSRQSAEMTRRPSGDANQPPTTLAFFETGALDAASPIYDRITTGVTDLTCNATSQDSINDSMAYVALKVEVSAVENLVASVNAAVTTLADTVLSLYCDPFDPAMPMNNLVAYNDDISQNNPLSGFVDSDGITLQPGTTYWLVLTTFESGDYGDYQVDVLTPTATPVEVQSFSIE